MYKEKDFMMTGTDGTRRLSRRAILSGFAATAGAALLAACGDTATAPTTAPSGSTGTTPSAAAVQPTAAACSNCFRYPPRHDRLRPTTTVTADDGFPCKRVRVRRYDEYGRCGSPECGETHRHDPTRLEGLHRGVHRRQHVPPAARSGGGKGGLQAESWRHARLSGRNGKGRY